MGGPSTLCGVVPARSGLYKKAGYSSQLVVLLYGLQFLPLGSCLDPTLASLNDGL